MAILYPDAIEGIGAAPSKKGKKSKKATNGKGPGPWRDAYVLPGKAGAVMVRTSTALVPTKGSSTALAEREHPREWWPWIFGGLAVLAAAFYLTTKKGKRRRPLAGAFA